MLVPFLNILEDLGVHQDQIASRMLVINLLIIVSFTKQFVRLKACLENCQFCGMTLQGKQPMRSKIQISLCSQQQDLEPKYDLGLKLKDFLVNSSVYDALVAKDLRPNLLITSSLKDVYSFQGFAYYLGTHHHTWSFDSFDRRQDSLDYSFNDS